MPASSLPGTARTTRNRKLECEGCGYVVRASRTMIRRGLPTCPCGARLVPSALEDALLAHECGHLTREELDAHPEALEYAAAWSDVVHGRTGYDKSIRAKPLEERGRHSKRTGAPLQDERSREARMAPDELAMHRVAKARTATAYAARLAALEPHRFGGAPTTDDIPF
jgi:hypothetical protein